MKDVISRRSKSPFKKLPRSFFRRPATELARALIGKILVRHIDGKAFRARVVETEAYLGPHDLASHASKGRTRRTEVLFGPAGRAYVYLIYGMYEMLNVVAEVWEKPKRYSSAPPSHLTVGRPISRGPVGLLGHFRLPARSTAWI